MTAKSSGRRGPSPEYVFEIDFVGGEEGRELELEQARALGKLLLWMSEQGLPTEPPNLASRAVSSDRRV